MTSLEQCLEILWIGVQDSIEARNGLVRPLEREQGIAPPEVGAQQLRIAGQRRSITVERGERPVQLQEGIAEQGVYPGRPRIRLQRLPCRHFRLRRIAGLDCDDRSQ